VQSRTLCLSATHPSHIDQPQQHRYQATQGYPEDFDLLGPDTLGLLGQYQIGKDEPTTATVDELQAIFEDLFEGADPTSIDIDKFCNEVIEEENASATMSGDHSPTLQGQGLVSSVASGIKREIWDPLVDASRWQTTSYSPAHHVPSPPASMVYIQPTPFDPLQADPLLFSPNDAPTTSTPTSLVEESVECNSNIWLTEFSSSPSDGGYEVEVAADVGLFGHNELFPFG